MTVTLGSGVPVCVANGDGVDVATSKGVFVGTGVKVGTSKSSGVEVGVLVGDAGWVRVGVFCGSADAVGDGIKYGVLVTVGRILCTEVGDAVGIALTVAVRVGVAPAIDSGVAATGDGVLPGGVLVGVLRPPIPVATLPGADVGTSVARAIAVAVAVAEECCALGVAVGGAKVLDGRTSAGRTASIGASIANSGDRVSKGPLPSLTVSASIAAAVGAALTSAGWLIMSADCTVAIGSARTVATGLLCSELVCISCIQCNQFSKTGAL
jgi:hypothetical protein